MITDPTRALEWLIGLPDVRFLGLEEGEVALVHVATSVARTGCPDCGSVARLKDRMSVTLTALRE